MFSELKLPSKRTCADVAIFFNTVVWGIQFIVMKDAFHDLAPLTFNALRFSIGLPFMLSIAFRHRAVMRIDRRDVPTLIALALFGQFGYQVFSVLGLKYTTSTNAALMIATIPTWTALLSIALGIIALRRPLLIGVGVSLGGAVLVILGGSGAALTVSHRDLVGVALTLCAALATSMFTIFVKPMVDRYGGLPVAIWMYTLTCLSLIVVASPDLVTLSPSDIPSGVLPHLLYAGLLSSALGFLIESFSIKELGSARVANYYNITPVIAALGGVLVLSEPVTVSLLVGGALTLLGVLLVRRNTFLILPPTAPHTAQAAPHAAPDPGPDRTRRTGRVQPVQGT